MAAFTSLVSKFKHDSDNQANQDNVRKRMLSSNLAAAEDSEEESTSSSLAFRTRKSLRLSTPHPNARLSSSRVIAADSIKSRPHYKREPFVETIKKEEAKEDVKENVKEEVKEEVKDKIKVEKKPRGKKPQGRNPGYSAPEVYAHLNLLPDIIDYDLDVLFVGINPGVRSSERCHHFAGPTNHFWPCLSNSGLLPAGVRMGPNDDISLPEIANMGLTNLVDRPSRMGNELSVAECRAAAPILTAKIKKYRPRFVCFVSKQAWDMFSGVGLGLQTAWISWYDEEEDRAVSGLDDDRSHAIQNNLDSQGYRLAPYLEDGPAPAKLEQELAGEGITSPFIKRENTGEVKQESAGSSSSSSDVRIKSKASEDIKPLKVELETQDQKPQGRPLRNLNLRGVRGSRMFVMPSTSGRVTQYRKEDKLAYFQQLAELVRRDRQMRGL